MKWIKEFSIFVIVILLSLIFAQQYDKGCSNTLYSHFFDFFGVIYSKGILEFMKNFNWALLVLILFLLPNCMNTIKSLIELIGIHVVNYGKATNTNVSNEPQQQDSKEQEEFQKTKEREIKETISSTDEKGTRRYKQRRENIEKLEQFIFEDIQGQNIENFTKDSKIVVDNDPISNLDNLYFDCSYRYKGKDRARRYVNTLFITGSLLLRIDRLYKYIRIMNDINSRKNNQRYIIELIYIVIDDKSYENEAYNRLQKMFSKAIFNGVLAIKKYKLENNKAILLAKDGWVLETAEDY